MQQLLIRAIRNRQGLIFRYPSGELIVEPHVYGHDARGKAVLLCYQVGSNRGAHQGWKLLSLEGADAVVAAEWTFSGARPGYRRGNADVCMPLAAI